MENFKPNSAPVDASLNSIVLARILDVSVTDGEVIVYSEPSDLAFSLKVSTLCSNFQLMTDNYIVIITSVVIVYDVISLTHMYR